MIKVLLADDEDLIRAALAALLGLEPDLQIVAEASDGRAAVDAALAHRPDVAVVDLEMPALDGLE
ncbi:MAG: response regulator transcription factor, partial [Pseudonocardiaceae bacterium]